MKSSCQKKRKAVEVSQENKKDTAGEVKNSVNRNCRQRQKPPPKGECKALLPENDPRDKPSSTAQPAGEKPLNKGQSIIETTKVQESKLQSGVILTSPKIKLQLFPVNSTTRLRLEKDGHNPFLELTLSAQKKISSVIKHLITKWGSSSAALGDLMLLPYEVSLDNITSSRRWTLDCCRITAGELHEALESPEIFRLRYGWFSNLHLEASGVASTYSAEEEAPESKDSGKDCNVLSRTKLDQMEKVDIASQEIRNPFHIHEAKVIPVTDKMPPPVPVDHMDDDVPAHSIVSWDDSWTSLSIGGLLSEASLLDKINNQSLKSQNRSNLQPIELISDISIGALLSEASLFDKINNCEQRLENASSLRPTQPVSAFDMCTGGLLSEAPSQSKIDNPDLQTELDAGLQPIRSASEISFGGLLSEASLQGNSNAFKATSNQKAIGLKPTTGKGSAESLFPWDDSLTSLSIGGLLSEASFQARFSGPDPKLKASISSLQSRLPTYDSSEAFATVQVNSHTPVPKPPLPDSFSSILDAEDTCHAFSFKKFSSSSKDSMTSTGRDESGGCYEDFKTSRFPRTNEVNNQTKLANNFAQKPMTNPLPLKTAASG